MDWIPIIIGLDVSSLTKFENEGFSNDDLNLDARIGR